MSKIVSYNKRSRLEIVVSAEQIHVVVRNEVSGDEFVHDISPLELWDQLRDAFSNIDVKTDLPGLHRRRLEAIVASVAGAALVYKGV